MTTESSPTALAMAHALPPEALVEILNDHRAWLIGQGGKRANLSCANLRGADLPHGYTWEVYLAEVVPAFLMAGGKMLADVATRETWACHSWKNSPTHAAFDANRLDDVPPLYRAEARQFILFFDSGLIPLPLPPTA
jgi:hypothetical protein